MQQVRPVLADLHGKIETQATKRVAGDLAGANGGRKESVCLIRGNVGHEFTSAALGGKCVQETPNVNLIAREVPADGMSINGNSHGPYQYNGALGPRAVLKIQSSPRRFPCKLFLQQ